MRRPAAVLGTYGQKRKYIFLFLIQLVVNEIIASQGMISLERVIPLGGATDTAGVFSRDPYK
jgi:hypothetical protein